MFKELNLEDPAFHDVEKTIEATPSGTITAYSAWVQTPYLRCPGEARRAPVHKLAPKEMKRLTPRYDIVYGEPAVVKLDVRYWRCPVCRRKFRDPACPFEPKKTTSDNFDNFIAQTLFSDLSLTEKSIAEHYGISRQIAQKAVSNYINGSIKNIYFVKLKCYCIWILRTKIGHNQGFVVLGKPSKGQGFSGEEDQIVFLGVTKTCKFESLCDEALSMDENTHAKILCPEDTSSTLGKYFKNASISALSFPHPDLLNRIENAILKMTIRGMSFEEIKLRIFFHDEFRRAEIRAQGAGEYLGPLVTNFQGDIQGINASTHHVPSDEHFGCAEDCGIGFLLEQMELVAQEDHPPDVIYYYTASVSKFLERYERDW